MQSISNNDIANDSCTEIQNNRNDELLLEMDFHKKHTRYTSQLK